MSVLMNVLDEEGSLEYKKLITKAKTILRTSQDENILMGMVAALDDLETKFENALNATPSPYNENQKVTLKDYKAEVGNLIGLFQQRVNELPRTGGRIRKSRRRKTTKRSKRRKSTRKRRNY
jgi:hypothetical protein